MAVLYASSLLWGSDGYPLVATHWPSGPNDVLDEREKEMRVTSEISTLNIGLQIRRIRQDSFSAWGIVSGTLVNDIKDLYRCDIESKWLYQSRFHRAALPRIDNYLDGGSRSRCIHLSDSGICLSLIPGLSANRSYHLPTSGYRDCQPSTLA